MDSRYRTLLDCMINHNVSLVADFEDNSTTNDEEDVRNLSSFRRINGLPAECFDIPLPDPKRFSRELVTYYLMGVFGMTACCFGVVGNLLSLIVLTRRSMRSSTYCYLAALAVCDLLVVVCTMILLLKDIHYPVELKKTWETNTGIYPYLFPFVHPSAFTLQVCSVWLTLSFTVDRYIMICHPFRSEPLCTVQRARKVVACLVLAALIFNLPKFFEYHTVVVKYPLNPDLPETIRCDLTEFGQSRIFKQLYHSWFYIVFIFGLPFGTLAVLNAFLVHAVRLSRQRCRELQQPVCAAETKRIDTTVMLIGVVVIFIVCQLPALVSRTIWAFEDNPHLVFNKLPFYTLNEFANFLVILNSSINIVPYYFFGKRFRLEFLALFCCCSKYRIDKRTFSMSLSRRDSPDNIQATNY